MHRLNQVDTPQGDRLRIQSATVRIPSNTANSTIVAAPGANKRIYVLKLFAQCGGTATTLTFDADTNQVHDMAANGGVHIPLDDCVILKTAVNTALKATTGVGSTTTVKVWYIISEEDF